MKLDDIRKNLKTKKGTPIPEDIFGTKGLFLRPFSAKLSLELAEIYQKAGAANEVDLETEITSEPMVEAVQRTAEELALVIHDKDGDVVFEGNVDFLIDELPKPDFERLVKLAQGETGKNDESRVKANSS